MTITGVLTNRKVTVGHGTKVHVGSFDEAGRFFGTCCGSERCTTGYRWSSKVRKSSFPVTCEKCLAKIEQGMKVEE
jgi:hypothetical protein